MAYVAKRGVEAKGKGVVSVDDLPRIKVVYAEAAFDCVSLVLPSGDLAASVELAMEHGVTQASSQLGLTEKHLHALPSAPLVKPDGSPVPVEEWVNNHFVLIKAREEKKEEGLLGKFRKQHTFLEGVLREGLRGLDVSRSKEAGADVPKMAEELRLLKAENASLRAKLPALEDDYTPQFTALEAENAALKDDVAALKDEVAAVKTENAALKDDVAALKDDVAALKHEIATVKAENVRLKDEVARLKAELEEVQKKIANLSGMDLVMVRKMLEACRTKCRAFLSERKVHIPYDWNKLIRDPVCIGVMEEAGLTIGLSATEFGKKSQQGKGSEAAHNITESPEAYATIVCKMHGNRRAQLMNVFEFVFGSRAEDLAFEDIP